MRIAICEDRADEAARLQSMLERWIEIQQLQADIAVFESGEVLLAAFEPGEFQIVFMDIYLGGQSGVETCRAIRKRDGECALILTTSSPDHGLDGFAVGAAHYLIKPIRPDALDEALRRCRHLLEGHGRVLEVSINRSQLAIPLRSILCIEVFGNNCVVHTQTQRHTVYATLESLRDQLDPAVFLRCHRSYVVNLVHVSGLDEQGFVLRDGGLVPVGRTLRATARQAWDGFIADSIRRRFSSAPM